MPVNYVGKKIVVPEPVFGVNLFVVDGEGTIQYTAFIFFHWVSTKFSRENIENFFSNPSPLGKRSEGEIIRIHFPKTIFDIVGSFTVSVICEPGSLCFQSFSL